MRYILTIIFALYSLSLDATNYYVKNGGNDDLTGLSDAQAWATMAKVNAFSYQPGDNIYFKCGDTWDSQIAPVISGTATNYITYSSYGTGEKPEINGTVRYTGWKEYSTNIYYVTNIYHSGYIVIIGNLWGTKVTNISDMNVQGEWRQTSPNQNGVRNLNDTMFIYTTNVSDTSNVICTKTWHGIFADKCNYIIFNNFKLSTIGVYGVIFANNRNIYVTSCEIDSTGSTGIVASNATNYFIHYNYIHHCGNDGIYLGYDSNYGDVYRNTFTYNGIGYVGDRQAIGAWISHDIKIRNNYIFHTVETAVEISSQYGNYYQTNIELSGNTIVGASINSTLVNVFFGEFRIFNNILRCTKGATYTTALYSGECNSTKSIIYFYNNTVIGVGWAFRPILVGTSTGTSYFELRNNIYYSIKYRYVDTNYLNANTLLSRITSDYNVFCSDVGSLWRHNATDYNFATWQTLSGQDAHSKALPVGWSGKVDFNPFTRHFSITGWART